jgi:hypothetical protein
MTASPNGSNIMSQLSGSPNNAADFYQHRDETVAVGALTTMASAASTAFYDQVPKLCVSHLQVNLNFNYVFI